MGKELTMDQQNKKSILLTDKNGELAPVHEAAEILGMTPGTLARMAVNIGMNTPEIKNLIEKATHSKA